MELKNKVAIVTGGAQGLGRAYSESLLRKGATVSLKGMNCLGLINITCYIVDYESNYFGLLSITTTKLN